MKSYNTTIGKVCRIPALVAGDLVQVYVDDAKAGSYFEYGLYSEDDATEAHADMISGGFIKSGAAIRGASKLYSQDNLLTLIAKEATSRFNVVVKLTAPATFKKISGRQVRC